MDLSIFYVFLQFLSKDNVLFYFSGYGAQQPESQTDGLYEALCAVMTSFEHE